MAPLKPVPNVLRVTYKGTVGPHNWVNILHYGWTGGAPTVAGLGEMANALAAQWGATMLDMQDPDTALTDIIITDLTSDLGAQVDVPEPITGTRSGELLPGSTCFLVTYPVARRWRGGHPRNYLCVGVQGDLNGPSNWSAAFQAAVNSAWTTQLASNIGNTYGTTTLGGQVAVSYVSGKVVLADPIVDALEGAIFHTELAQQRRRIGRK